MLRSETPTPPDAASIDQARRVQEAWWSGFDREDVEGLASLFAPDATFWDPRYRPFAGQANIHRYYASLLAVTTDWGGAHDGPYVRGPGVFAVWTRTEYRHRQSGVRVDFPMVGFFKLRGDGKVTSYEEYWDTAAMLKQLGIPSFGPEPDFSKPPITPA